MSKGSFCDGSGTRPNTQRRDICQTQTVDRTQSDIVFCEVQDILRMVLRSSTWPAQQSGHKTCHQMFENRSGTKQNVLIRRQNMSGSMRYVLVG